MTAPTRSSTTTGRPATLIATSLGFAVVQLDVSVVNVAVRPIGAELGGGVSGLQWVIDAYTVAFAALLLTAGALGDRLGAKRVLLAGFGLFTTASVACGLAPDLTALIGARVAQGAGAAVLGACSLTLLSHAYPDPAQRARAVGLWAAGASVALSAGPLAGGLLIETLGWRAIFLINTPLGLAGMGLLLRYAAETPRAPGRGVDLPGQVVAILALTATATATIEGGAHGFAHPAVLTGYALAGLAAVAFLRIESRRRSPMLPLWLFGSAPFRACTGIGLLVNVAFYGLIFVLSLYFQQTRHASALSTGLALLPITVAILAANLTSGWLSGVVGTRRVLTAGALAMAAGCAGLLGNTANTPYPLFVGQFVLLGLGLGVLVPAMTSALLGSVPVGYAGVAAGTLNTARQSGSVLGVAVFGALIAHGDIEPGLRVALLVSLGLALAAAALTTRVRTGRAVPG